MKHGLEWEEFLNNQYTCLKEDIQQDIQPEQWIVTDFNVEGMKINNSVIHYNTFYYIILDNIRRPGADQTAMEQNQELATMFSEERRSCNVCIYELLYIAKLPAWASDY